jgi:hypothetical protein
MLCSKDQQKAEAEKQNTEKIGGFMKKVLVLGLVLAMVLAPGVAKACWLTDLLNSDFVNMVCAGESGQITAADMLQALELGQSLYAGAPFDLEKAVAVLSYVKKTGCFLTSELKKAFEVVDAVNGAMAAKQMKMLKAAPPSLPEYAPLRQLVK